MIKLLKIYEIKTKSQNFVVNFLKLSFKSTNKMCIIFGSQMAMSVQQCQCMATFINSFHFY